MRRPLTLIVALALTTAAAPSLAGGPSDPEVPDEKGDVDVQHLVDAGLFSDLNDAGVSPPTVESSGDVLQAWVDKETKQAFSIVVEVANITDHEKAQTPVVEVWTHFTIREGSFHTLASLKSPQPGAPLQADYELYKGDGDQDSLTSESDKLSGRVDTDKNQVRFTVPKPDVRDPDEDDQLTEFYVTTHLPGSQAVLDYAPGVNSENVPKSAESVDAEPTDLTLAMNPNYGQTYQFQSFEEIPSDLDLDAVPGSIETTAGEQATFKLTINNGADKEESVSLSVSNTPDGWSTTVEPGDLTVSPKSSGSSELLVTPPADADGREFVEVTATTDGAEKSVSVSVVAEQPEPPANNQDDPNQGTTDDSGTQDDGQASGGTDATDGSGSGAGTDAGSAGGQADEAAANESQPANASETNDSPMLGPAALVGVIAGAAAWLRRRN